MASVQLTDEAVTVHLAGWEALTALTRFTGRHRTVRIPLTALTSVTATNEWITEPFGLRHGGVVVSGLLKVGVWRTLSGVRRLLVIRRGEPTLRLTCVATADFHEVLIGTADAHRLAGELQARAPR